MKSNVVQFDRPTYYGIDAVVVGKYTVGIEKVSAALPHLKRLAKEHWEETEVLYKQGTQDPDWNTYITLEKEGKYILISARHSETGELIGYLKYYLYSSVHQKKEIEAREDAFFISKQHRGGALASSMVSFATRTFRKMGVGQMGMSSKAPAGGPDLDKFLRRQGFTPVAIFYYKDLHDTESEEKS